MNHVSLNLDSTLEQCVMACFEQRLPVLIRGRHGIGKSEWAKQLAKKLKWGSNPEQGLPVVEVRLSQMTEGDIIGMPSAKPKKIGMLEATSFNPPDWFARACVEPCVLFFDELDRAGREVRQGTFQVSDSRRIHGNTLHPDTVVLAAINGGPSGDDYQVQELDKAENSRWQIFDVEPDFQIWKRWAESKNYDKGFLDYLSANETLFAPKSNPNLPAWTVQPNPRQWSRLHEILRATKLTEREVALSSAKTVLAVFASAVGTDAGQKYIKFQQERISFSLLDVIKKPEMLEDYFKKSKQADVVEKITEIFDEIHNSQSWIWSFDPHETYTSGPRRGAIKASFFMDALYLGMKDNAELCLPYIYSMIMGIQLQVLEKIKAEYQDTNERKAKIDELQMRLKCIFGSFVEDVPGKAQFLTGKNFKDKKYMMDHHFSYDSRICEFVRDEVSKAEDKIQEFIDSKAKKES